MTKLAHFARMEGYVTMLEIQVGHLSMLIWQGTPEDLMFFYKHLSTGGKLLRADKPLMVYRYHQHSESFSIDR